MSIVLKLQKEYGECSGRLIMENEPQGIIALNKEHETWIKEKQRIEAHIAILKESLFIEEAFLDFLNKRIDQIETP